MQILFTLLIICFVQFSLNAQKHDEVWLLGYGSNPLNTIYGGTVIDFSTIPPDMYYEFRPMSFRQANASMSDTAGNLLFYTNGIYIANALHEPMENGTGLAAGPEGAQNEGLYGYILAQGVLALPISEHDSLFHLLHMDRKMNQQQTGTESLNLFVTLVNMNANNGLGAVVYKNHSVLSGPFDIGKITAARHANGRDWWVILRRYGANIFVRLLVTANGIIAYPSQALGAAIPEPPASLGQAVFSPDGTKYAKMNITGSAGDPIYVSIFDFDRCSGELSRPVQFTYSDTAWAGGISISPNSRFLYVSSFRYVYQYDLHASDIEASRITVAEWDGFFDGHPNFPTRFYLAQLGPDGKIYINSSSSTKYLHVINNPDSLALACDVCQHCVELPTKNSFSLPNFPNYRLHHLEGSPCDTLRQPPVAEWEYEPQGLEIDFQDASYHDIHTWHWSFGDGAVDTVPNPVHSYAAAGVYNVCLAVSNPRGADTLCREVQVLVSSAGFDSAQPATLKVEIWPNPVPSNVPATLVAEGIPASETGRGLSVVEIRDALGRTILRFTAPIVNGRIRQELDVSGLVAGVYFVELTAANGASLWGGKILKL
jgi:hypothetical protein